MLISADVRQKSLIDGGKKMKDLAVEPSELAPLSLGECVKGRLEVILVERCDATWKGRACLLEYLREFRKLGDAKRMQRVGNESPALIQEELRVTTIPDFP